MDGTIGEIRLFAGNFAPRGWMLCHGQLLPIPKKLPEASSETSLAQSEYAPIHSIIGVMYGADGKGNFALPDLRARVPIGAGQDPNGGISNYELGTKIGHEKVVLKSKNIPPLTGKVDSLSLNASASGNINDTTSVAIKIPCSNNTQTEFVAENNVLGSDSPFGVKNLVYAPSANAFLKPFNVTVPIQASVDLPISVNSSQGVVSVNKETHSVPVSNVQPVTALNYIICVEGVFPSRS